VNDWFSDERATFGDRMAGAREAAGMTQEELARRLGVKRTTIRAWEDDMSEPRANRLQMLAGMLNVSLRWLLTGEGDGIPEPDAEGPAPDVAAVLTDLRLMRAEMGRMADRIGHLEKRLRLAARGAA
jgi:HTH-type transcriptional regulator, cell division transcriptional repressor